MSNMTHIRAAFSDDLSTTAEPSERERVANRVRSEVGPAIVAIAASVIMMAGLMAFRLWWLMPASIHIQN